MRTILIAFAIALLVSLMLTWGVRAWARRHLVFDAGFGRKVHQGGIPRLGGIAVVLGFATPIVGLALWTNKISAMVFQDRQLLLALALGGGLLFLVGLLDDVRGVGARWKLLAQVAAALVAFGVGIEIKHLSLPLLGTLHLGMAALPLTVFWFLLVTNAINLVDGLDGLAGSVVVLATGTLLGMSLVENDFLSALVLASVLGSSLGFLRFNVRPASIFMGDSGSLFLGYVLALISVNGSQKSYALFSLTAALLALGVPIFDVGMAFVRRLLTGKSVFAADQHHVHHLLLRKGLNQQQSVWVMAGASASLGLLAFILVYSDDRLSAAALVTAALLMGVAVRGLGYGELIRSGRREALLGDSEAKAHAQLQAVLALRDQMRTSSSPEEVLGLIKGACEQGIGFERVEIRLTEPDLSLRWQSEALENNQDVHFQNLEADVFQIRVSNRIKGEVGVTWYQENAVLRAHHCALGQLLADGLLEMTVAPGVEGTVQRKDELAS